MVQVIKKKEKIIYNRLARRGFSKEDCQDIINNKPGGVIFVNKRKTKPSKKIIYTGSRVC